MALSRLATGAWGSPLPSLLGAARVSEFASTQGRECRVMQPMPRRREKEEKMNDTITLTREEVTEARENFIKFPSSFPCFWDFKEQCDPGRYGLGGICRLCKRLTDFAKGGEHEIVGTEE